MSELECGHSTMRKRIVEGFDPKIIIDEDGDRWERTLCYCSFCNIVFHDFRRLAQ